MNTRRAGRWRLLALLAGCTVLVAALLPPAPNSVAAAWELPSASALVAAAGHGRPFGLPAAALCSLTDATDDLPRAPLAGALTVFALLSRADCRAGFAPCATAPRPARPTWYPLRC